MTLQEPQSSISELSDIGVQKEGHGGAPANWQRIGFGALKSSLVWQYF